MTGGGLGEQGHRGSTAGRSHTRFFCFAMWGNVGGPLAGGRRGQITLADVPKRPSVWAPGRQAWARRFGTRDMGTGLHQAGPVAPAGTAGPGPCSAQATAWPGSMSGPGRGFQGFNLGF